MALGFSGATDLPGLSSGMACVCSSSSCSQGKRHQPCLGLAWNAMKHHHEKQLTVAEAGNSAALEYANAADLNRGKDILNTSKQRQG